jgi:hypothetical protein
MFRDFIQIVCSRKQPRVTKWTTSPKTSSDYEQVCRTLGKELGDLEARAGIAAKADDASLGPLVPLYYNSDAPLFSERGKAEREVERQHKQDYIRRKIRSLYFSVPDLDLRKQLIEKERELTDNWRYSTRTDVQAAEIGLSQAKASGQNWYLRASLSAIVFVAIGWSLFQLPGALAGTLVAYFYGR